MGGGVDMLYTQYFGWQVQERLQAAIRERHHGELLVGQAEIVETDNPDLPFLIAAPTMRVPMILRESVNLYLAARAAIEDVLLQSNNFPLTWADAQFRHQQLYTDRVRDLQQE